MTRASAAGGPEKAYLTDLDIGKVLGIILVVFGHLTLRSPPVGNDWYWAVRIVIYGFHMPLFMFLSGLVYFHFMHWLAFERAPGSFVAKKAERLLTPFFGLAILIAAGKMAGAYFMHVDAAPLSVWSALDGIFWRTGASPAQSIWFVFVMFEYMVVTSIIMTKAPRLIHLAIVLAAVAYLFDFPRYVYLDKFFRHYVFFLLAYLATRDYAGYTQQIDRYRWLLVVLFCVSIAAIFHTGATRWFNLIFAVLASVMVHSLARIDAIRNNALLNWLRPYVFSIYLFNTLAIGLAKGVILKFVNWDYAMFIPISMLLLVAGLGLPVLLKRYLLSRNRRLDAWTN